MLWVLAGRAAEGSTVHASTDHFSVVCPDGAHQVGLAEPHKQPAVRPSTGQLSDLAALSGSAVSTQLEALTPSPLRAHSFAFTEAGFHRV